VLCQAIFYRYQPMELKMKSKAVVSAIMAMSLTLGGFSFAQDNRERDDGGRNAQAQRRGQQDRRNNNARQQDRPQEQNRGYNSARRDERGAGPGHAFHQGGRLPDQYRSRQYVVNDWRGHQLSAPPRGYQWVQTGSDYVLVAIATGIILQLLLNN
jgi:Ni/Co efflux regulator RcnB